MSYTITNGLCALADVKAALNISDTKDDDRISLAIDATSRLIEKACNRRFWQDPVPRTDAGCVLASGSNIINDAAVVALDAGRSVIDPTGHGYVQAGSVVGTVTPGVSFTVVNFEGVALPVTGSATQNIQLGLSPRRFVVEDSWLVHTDDISTREGLIVESDYAGDGTFSTTWGPQDFQLEPVNGIVNGQAGWPATKIRAIRSLYFPVWGGISFPQPYTQALVRITARWGWTAVPSDVTQAAIIQTISTFKAGDVPFGASAFPESGIIRLKEALHPSAAMLLEDYRDEPVLVA
jgi:hypothetical protein